MDKKLIKEILEYIEKCEVSFMWEFSGNILENKDLFKDSKRMPNIYFNLKKLIN